MIVNNALFSEFSQEAEELLSDARDKLELLKRDHQNQDKADELINDLYRVMHTLKGSSQLIGMFEFATLTHTVETILSPVREKKLAANKTLFYVFEKTLDELESMLSLQGLMDEDEEVSRSKCQKMVCFILEAVFPEMIQDKNKSLINVDFLWEEPSTGKIKEVGMEQGSSFDANIDGLENDNANESDNLSSFKDSQPPSASAKVNQSEDVVAEKPVEVIKQEEEKEEAPKKEVAMAAKPAALKIETTEQPQVIKEAEASTAPSAPQTIRVNLNLLDHLMSMVGEMVLVRNQFLQYAKVHQDHAYTSLTQRLDVVTADLQDTVMQTRMQPIGNIFSKLSRVVRDLSRDLNKSIDLQVIGQETEIDRSLLELVKDPLTHIIRNACDHGIGNKEQRQEQGKSVKGKIILSAYQEGGRVVVEIKDDGNGIDPERIRDKAIEKGICTPEELRQFNTKAIQNLIFHAGFSTAEQVTSVSGRGVGMDVVKTNIEKIGGSVEVESRVGVGSTFKLYIPLTLAIVPALVVSIEDEVFAIAQIKVQELLRVRADDVDNRIETIQGQEYLRLRGSIVPLVDLGELLNQRESEKSDAKNIVLINHEGQTFGLIIDQVINTFDIVVKPLVSFLKAVRVFSGATLMGDGRVALILDMAGIAEMASLKQIAADKDKVSAENHKLTNTFLSHESSDYLLFDYYGEDKFAIPLTLVGRLEEVDGAEIKESGGELLLYYRDKLMPVIDLSKEVLGETTPINKEDRVSLIIINKRGKLYGVRVGRVIDLVQSDKEVAPLMKERFGVYGTLYLSESLVCTVLDVMGVLNKHLGVSDVFEEVPTDSLDGKRVLLVEDSHFFAKQIRKVLDEHKMSVNLKVNGEEALEHLKEHASEYDLIISDIEMPKMDGYQLIKKIRSEENLKDLKVIAITTRFSEEDRARGQRLGFNFYLEKLRSDELVTHMVQLIKAS